MVANVSDEEMQEHYDNFFEDVFVECEDKVSIVSVEYLSKGPTFLLEAVILMCILVSV